MYTPVQLALKYIRYYLLADNGKGHGIHSPFVYDLITKVLNDDRHFYVFQPIEDCRKMLQLNKTEIIIQDFGAGSRIKKSSVRTLAAIATTSLKPKKYGQLLFRLANYFSPKTILELGTSLGITSAYMASANSNAKLITMEGSTAIAAIAATNFDQLGIRNATIITGNFDTTLAETLESIGLINFAFLDGNHRYEPTIRYFEQIIQKSNEYTVIVLDDIHWSTEMEVAWNEVKNHHLVTLTIDLFYLGLIFLRKEQKEKQHFVIRY